MDIYGDLPPSPRLPSPQPATAEASTSTAQVASPTLDQELDAFKSSLTNVGASLGSFWGSVRKQSVTAYAASRRELEALNEAARKDFAPLVNKARDDLGPLVNKAREDIAPYVSKAKEELNKFGEQAKNSAAAGQAVATGAAPPPSDNLVPGGGSTASSSSSISSSASAETLGPTSTVTDQPKEATMGDISFYGEVMTSPNSGTAPPLPDEAPAQVNALLHKMQALQTQIQANPSIAQLSRTLPNLSQIQGNIATLQSRLPGQLSGAEAYLGRATKEFSDLLKDAVRVVPPTADAAAGSSTATTSRGAMTRKEGLLHRLRSDPQVMLVDPAQPPAELPADAAATTETAESVAAKVDDFKSRTDAREDFAKFLQAIEDEGGLEGEGWRAKVEGELALGDGEGSALAGTLAALVPAKMPAEAFWTRYFFRVHQIDEDDARRRQVLEGAALQNEDDFSWDAEEDDASSPKMATAPAEAKGKAPETDDAGASPDTSPSLVNAPTTSGAPSTTQGSGRNSSEEGTAMSTSSYDVVSRKVSEDEKPSKDEDEDSDWE